MSAEHSREVSSNIFEDKETKSNPMPVPSDPQHQLTGSLTPHATTLQPITMPHIQGRLPD